MEGCCGRESSSDLKLKARQKSKTYQRKFLFYSVLQNLGYVFHPFWVPGFKCRKIHFRTRKQFVAAKINSGID